MDRMSRGGQTSKAILRRMLISLLAAFFAAALTLTSCAREAINPNLKRLGEDTEWTANLSKWLDLAYVERGDVALFGGVSDVHPLGPSLYTTWAVVRLLKAAGADIPNTRRIADWIESTRDERGAYVDPFLVGAAHFMPPEETMRAVETLIELGSKPENIEATVQYLFSLEYEDGTFLIDERGPGDVDQTALRRITYGTNYVVRTLSMLGRTHQVPEKTRSVVASEIKGLLGDGAFPRLDDQAAWTLIDGIETLAKLDTALVTEREREFISEALMTAADQVGDPFTFTSRVNRLLDTAELLGLPEAHDPEILEAIESSFTERILPLQNNLGGFGPSETIEPFTTSENVILASRLGVPYPNLDKLVSELNRHWLGDSWAAFLLYQPNNSDIGWTYNWVELASFVGYEYDRVKVSNFLRGYLSGEAYADEASSSWENPANVPDWGLRDLYYSVKGLKAVNGSLTAEDKKNAETRCRELIDTGAMDGFGFRYVLPIAREVGFSLEKKVVVRVQELAKAYKETTIAEQEFPSIATLESLYSATDPQGSIISREEIMQYLDHAYDEETGSYVLPTIDGRSVAQGLPEGTPRPDIHETYYAVKLLSEIGENVPDPSRTIDFVLNSKQKYGFGREPTWPYDPNVKNTWAGMMILKELGQSSTGS